MWRRPLWIALIIILGLCLLIPTSVGVAMNTTVTVQIYAQGYVTFPGAPSGLTITYISDYELQLTWTKAGTANMTLIRGAYGREITDRDDGFEVYYGAGNYTTHWISDVGLIGPIYYKAWSRDAGGNWSVLSTEEDAGFMSSSFLFIGLILLAGMLTFFSWKRRHILISLSAALTWLSLGFWLLLGEVTNLNLADPWPKILAWVFIMMVFFCFLTLMDVEIQKEAKGKGRWTEFGTKPREEKPSSYETYRMELRKRLRR